MHTCTHHTYIDTHIHTYPGRVDGAMGSLRVLLGGHAQSVVDRVRGRGARRTHARHALSGRLVHDGGGRAANVGHGGAVGRGVVHLGEETGKGREGGGGIVYFA